MSYIQDAADIERLRNKVLRKEEEIKELDHLLDIQADEIQEVENEAGRLKEEVKLLTEQNHTLEKDNDWYIVVNSMLEKENNKLREELARKIVELER